MLSMGSFGFYMINFLIKQLKGDMAINSIVAQISDLTSCMGCFILYNNFKMKNALLLAFSVNIVGLGLLLVFRECDSVVLMPFLVFISRVGIATGFIMSMMAVISLMPTILTSTIFGGCLVLARVFTMAAPIVAEQPQPIPVLCGIGSSLLAIMASRLIDTKKPDFI